jgi:hypothetical protein
LSQIPDLYARLPGDYNRDGVVDGADYVVWRRGMHTGGSLAADGSRNGVVDHADYDVWRLHFGATAGGSVAVSAIPETMSWLFLVTALIPLRRIMRRRT